MGAVDIVVDCFSLNGRSLDIPHLQGWFLNPLQIYTRALDIRGKKWIVFCAVYADKDEHSGTEKRRAESVFFRQGGVADLKLCGVGDSPPDLAYVIRMCVRSLCPFPSCSLTYVQPCR